MLIINNVTTAIALDVGIKMLGRCSFLDIVKAARETYAFEIQYLREYPEEETSLFPACRAWALQKSFRRPCARWLTRLSLIL